MLTDWTEEDIDAVYAKAQARYDAGVAAHEKSGLAGITSDDYWGLAAIEIPGLLLSIRALREQLILLRMTAIKASLPE
jgi:hypothetical protein